MKHQHFKDLVSKRQKNSPLDIKGLQALCKTPLAAIFLAFTALAEHIPVLLGIHQLDSRSTFSWRPEESPVESSKHQDNANIHCQPFPESVSEEREIYTDYDGCHRHHVKHYSYLSAHAEADNSVFLRTSEVAIERLERVR